MLSSLISSLATELLLHQPLKGPTMEMILVHLGNYMYWIGFIGLHGLMIHF